MIIDALDINILW